MHVAGSGRVIVRLSEPLPEGQVLCDRGGREVAKVMELIGPVSAPMASAAPLGGGAGRGGAKLFAGGAPRQRARKARGRQRWTR